MLQSTQGVWISQPKTIRWAGIWVVLSLAGPAVATDGLPTLDQLLEIDPPSTQPRSEDAAPPHDAGGAELLEKLERSEPADVFGEAVEQMNRVADRIATGRDVGLATQRLQSSIVDKLDQVIAAAKQMNLRSGSGGSSASGGPAQRQDTGSELNTSQGDDASSGGQASASGQGSSGRGGAASSPGQTRQRSALDEQRQQWGNLPQRLRDDVLQGINERFSSVYRELTGQYYRRLAQEEDEP